MHLLKIKQKNVSFSIISSYSQSYQNSILDIKQIVYYIHYPEREVSRTGTEGTQ